MIKTNARKSSTEISTLRIFSLSCVLHFFLSHHAAIVRIRASYKYNHAIKTIVNPAAIIVVLLHR